MNISLQQSYYFMNNRLWIYIGIIQFIKHKYTDEKACLLKEPVNWLQKESHEVHDFL